MFPHPYLPSSLFFLLPNSPLSLKGELGGWKVSNSHAEAEVREET